MAIGLHAGITDAQDAAYERRSFRAGPGARGALRGAARRTLRNWWGPTCSTPSSRRLPPTAGCSHDAVPAAVHRRHLVAETLAVPRTPRRPGKVTLSFSDPKNRSNRKTVTLSVSEENVTLSVSELHRRILPRNGKCHRFSSSTRRSSPETESVTVFVTVFAASPSRRRLKNRGLSCRPGFKRETHANLARARPPPALTPSAQEVSSSADRPSSCRNWRDRPG